MAFFIFVTFVMAVIYELKCIQKPERSAWYNRMVNAKSIPEDALTTIGLISAFNLAYWFAILYGAWFFRGATKPLAIALLGVTLVSSLVNRKRQNLLFVRIDSSISLVFDLAIVILLLKARRG